MSAVAIGVVVALLGVAGAIVALTHRRGLRDLAREHLYLLQRQAYLDLREQRLERDARALYEWEGRLRQVAECGCPVPERTPDLPWSEDEQAGAA